MITEFQGKYRFLSNFWITPIEYDGDIYPSVEHAYQASKTLNADERRKIRTANTPGQAKRLGGTTSIRYDWEKIKYRIMYDLVSQKFSTGILKQQLLDTGDEELQEGNRWGDTYWGISLITGEGENNLGNILMLIRGKLKEKHHENSIH